jgi:thioredoxin-like negative regulator of GroEL
MDNNNYNLKYLKYKEKYLALQKEYEELLKSKNKQNLKGGSNKVDIILFKADWCGHCNNFKPTWDKVAELYNKKFNFIIYDADKQRAKFEEYKVDSFPTVLVKNGSNIIPYDGERSIEDLSNFLNNF